MMRYIDLTVEEDEITEGVNLNEPLYMQKLEEVFACFDPVVNMKLL
jgi:DNA replication licensing factor MCM4